jgi:hypothetical protein
MVNSMGCSGADSDRLLSLFWDARCSDRLLVLF